jgi:hypothetical protein
MYNYTIRYWSYGLDNNIYGVVSKSPLTTIQIVNKLLDHCLDRDDDLIEIYSIEEREVEL